MVDIFHYPFPLYRLFFCPANRVWGHNAELLIDHAWGWEPCTIADIKAYKPEASSVGSGQVLECPYDFVRTRLVVREMADQLALSLVESRLVTRQIVLTVGYDIENLTDETRSKAYRGEVKAVSYTHLDVYKRQVNTFPGLVHTARHTMRAGGTRSR